VIGRVLINPLSVSAAQSMSASLRKRPKCYVAAKRRYVPKAGSCTAANPHRYSITSTAHARSAAALADREAGRTSGDRQGIGDLFAALGRQGFSGRPFWAADPLAPLGFHCLGSQSERAIRPTAS